MNRPLKTAADHANDLAHLEQVVKQHLAAGEIDKPSYDSLKYKVERALEGTSEVISREHLYGKGGAIYDLARYGRDEKHWAAVVSAAHMNYARDVLSAEKKLAKIKTDALKAHPLFKDIAAYVGRYKQVAADLIELKTKIVSTQLRRAKQAVREEEERQAKFTEYKTLVVVLQAHLDAYITRAADMAEEDFDGWMKEIESFDWNLDRIAPAPTRDDNEALYQFKDRRRSLFLFTTDEKSRDDQITRKFSPKKKAAHITRAKDDARASYMAWIYKMIQKIGQPVKSATMTGDPWIQSIVSVVCQDGSKQVWHTQMILNRSKYNRPFHQFPSRRTDK